MQRTALSKAQEETVLNLKLGIRQWPERDVDREELRRPRIFTLQLEGTRTAVCSELILLHYSCARALKGYYLPGNRAAFKRRMRTMKLTEISIHEPWGLGLRWMFAVRRFLNVCFGELSYFSKIYEVLTTVESQRECDIVFHSFHLDNRGFGLHWEER